MNKNKTKTFLLFVVGALAGMFLMYIFNNYTIEKKGNETPYVTTVDDAKNEQIQQDRIEEKSTSFSEHIDDLTEEKSVISYVKANGKLPEFYLTKSEARNRGWVPNKGNLCDVLPGKAIGGDRFSNREKQLPKDNQYFEADVNYDCGHRGADRIVYTRDGDVWLTHDHYKSFDKQ